jgi:DNA-binding NarL/FixJ family response regulator
VISVLLVEDHAIVSRSIADFLIGTDIVITAVAHSGEDALALLPGLAVDVAIIDVSLPGMSGIDLLPLLREESPNLPCMMLSGHRHANYVRRAISAGARGYVTKENPLALQEGIYRVAAGEFYISKDLNQDAIEMPEL